MKDSDAAVVLALCATFDQRTIGRMDAAAWGRVLGDIDVQDALAAVDTWYASHRERIMPADVLAGAGLIRRRREGQQRIAEQERQIAAENPDDGSIDGRPLRALLAGTPLKPMPRVERWPTPAPVVAKPPFTVEELAAAKAALSATATVATPCENSTRSEATT